MPVQPTGIPRPTTLPFIHVYDHHFTTSTLFDPKLEHSDPLFETSFTRKLCLHELEPIVALTEVPTGHCSTSSDFMFCYASLTKAHR